jgi:hypothetical protein
MPHTHTCEQCRDTKTPTVQYDGAYRCPDCHKRSLLYDAAKASLDTQFKDAFNAWADHWALIGVNATERRECLEAFIEDLDSSVTA